MAEIFLAKRQGYSGFEKVVALKKILPHYSEKPAFAEMLIHEAKLAAKLQHFNVVQVLDLGAVDSQVYIAMEYVHGRDLSAVLANNHRRKECLPVELGLCIATEFLTGLDYAHRLQDNQGRQIGLIHRDISPQNILLSYEGEVKVTDFGIARAFSPSTEKPSPGTMQGKFGYMSPEQVLKKEIDQRADIFSSGVVLHELLTGKRLYRGKTPEDSMDQILNKVVPAPSTFSAEVPPQLDAIVAKALHPDREERYQTVGSLIGDLAQTADRMPRSATRRDLAVYMRRQFGASAPRPRSSAPAPHRSQMRPTVSLVSSFSATSGTRTPVGDILISREIITISQLDIALAQQRARGGRIGEILIETGIISERSLAEALSVQLDFPLLEANKLIEEKPLDDVFRLFPLEAAKSMCVFPINVDTKASKATLAVADPLDQRSLLEAKIILGVNDFDLFLRTKEEIREATLKWYTKADFDNSQSVDLGKVDSLSHAASDSVANAIPLILIADSSDELGEALGNRLRDEEWEVIVVKDGKAAKAICQSRTINAAFVETNLPGIDGYNILLEIRGRNTNSAIFMTSSRADDFHQAKAMDLGADDFLVKPINIEVTAAKLRREIEKRGVQNRSNAGLPLKFAGVSGSLQDMTFVDIIQSIELAKKTALVVAQYDDGRSGEVVLIEGRVRYAAGGHLSGEDAFYFLAADGNGMFRIEYKETDYVANIQNNNTFLLLEAIRRVEPEKQGDSKTALLWEESESTPPLSFKALQPTPEDAPANSHFVDSELSQDLVADLVLSQAPPSLVEPPAEEDPTAEVVIEDLRKLIKPQARDVDDSNVFIWSPVVSQSSALQPPLESTSEEIEIDSFQLDILDPSLDDGITEIPPLESEEEATVMEFDVAAINQRLEQESLLDSEVALELDDGQSQGNSGRSFHDEVTAERKDPLTSLPPIDPNLLFDNLSRQEVGDTPLMGFEDILGKGVDRVGPESVKPSQNFDPESDNLSSLPPLPGQALTQETKPKMAVQPDPVEQSGAIPLPLDALIQCEVESKEPASSQPIPLERNSSDGQQLAKVALQKRALPRKESKYGNAAVEKIAVKHIDHSRRPLSGIENSATNKNLEAPKDDMDDALMLSIEDIVLDD